MSKHIWVFKLQKSKSSVKPSFYASATHGNDKAVIYMKGYNTKHSLIKSIQQLFPINLYKINDLTIKNKKK